MDIFASVYFRHVRVCMTIFGLWPYLTRFQAYLMRLCSVMLGSTIVVPTVDTFSQLPLLSPIAIILLAYILQICKMVEFIKLGEDTLWAIPSQLYYVENYGKIVYVSMVQDRVRRSYPSRGIQHC